MLTACVDSLVRQTYHQFEIIVVDQAKDSRLEGILRRYFNNDAKIRYVRVVSAGAARARNIGVTRAKGAIVAFIDDDAVAEPMWLHAVAEAFSDEPTPALMAGRLLPMWTGRRPEWYPKQREYLLGLYDIGDEPCPLPEADLPIGANMAGLREVILSAGGFDERLGPNYFRKRKMLTGEETILGQRIRSSRYRIVYQPFAIVRHRVSSHKQTRGYFLKRHFWEGVTVIEQMDLMGKIGPDTSPFYRFHCRELCMALARFALPRYRNNYSDSNVVIRMLALSRVAYSLGVMYGLNTRHTDTVPASTCASA